MTFGDLLKKLSTRTSLTREEARFGISEVMAGKASPVQIAGFLLGLRGKGETTEEIAGAAEGMRSAAVAVTSKHKFLVDTCGTGGDGQSSFNISTATAFVVAGAGIPVAKHGNRSVSSVCGSADLLEALGLKVESDPAAAGRTLDEVGLAFLFAPSFHPAMKHAAPVRKELGVRTLFNLLGPLTNPAKPHVQLIGVYDAAWVGPIAEVLVQLGAQHGIVVHGQGHDEIISSGVTEVAEIVNGRVEKHRWAPEDFGQKTNPSDSVSSPSKEQNVRILAGILAGEKSPYRTAVCMNAGALLRAAARAQAGKSVSLQESFAQAEESIDSGKARAKLEALLHGARKAT